MSRFLGQYYTKTQQARSVFMFTPLSTTSLVDVGQVEHTRVICYSPAQCPCHNGPWGYKADRGEVSCPYRALRSGEVCTKLHKPGHIGDEWTGSYNTITLTVLPLFVLKCSKLHQVNQEALYNLFECVINIIKSMIIKDQKIISPKYLKI